MVKQTLYIMSSRIIMSTTPMHFKANECNFCNLDTVFLRPSRRTNKLPITSDQTPFIHSLVKTFQVHLGFVSEKNLVQDLNTQLKTNLNESETSVIITKPRSDTASACKRNHSYCIALGFTTFAYLCLRLGTARSRTQFT